ncbi:ACR3 family arsenite efflux transporter [Fodinibius saliphilus]|uniref:ACR3 family arsenite efflux transporter n=1 Tax=Fodinibius saliphilus TaxID=1920650 RepID=UPI0011081FD8|nr:ACR3 family arsenite efflux transporter [Fodinibius saliphilus]
MSFFERFLTVWVLLCIAIGIGLGAILGDQIELLSDLTFYQVNIPVAILIWLMIYPMMLKIDFSSLSNIGKSPKGVVWTVIINWLVKPFSMAFFAWLFFDQIYSAWLSPELADQYIAGAIILGAAPCTAMVFVWSYLTDGDPNYTLVQVSVNDLIILIAFIPIVSLLLGITDIQIPYNTLIVSVVAFVVIPLVGGYLTHKVLVNRKGEEWYTETFLPKFEPLSISALLITLVLLFAYQGERILAQPMDIVFIAIPLAIQTYIIFGLAWYGGRWINLSYRVCAPASMIGASNFFELAVAVAIALFGLQSGAALTTVVGVLIEVPIMLSLVKFANKNRYQDSVNTAED